MVADERDKSAPFERTLDECRTLLFNEPQFLMIRVADWKNHSAALGELGEERLGNCGSRGSHEDSVERRKFRQAKCPVAAMNVHVVEAEPRETLRGR
jgi:hypothetical protein